MEPDCYLVEVIHYLNPHLIWVRNRSNDTLEQIGVYGIVPLDRELLHGTHDVETRISTDWMQAVEYVMKKVFMDATAISFQPIHLHRRSSIFDNNIHKYGEIFIEKKDGKRRKLSSYLLKSLCGLYDEAAFHQQLSLGHVKTKLTKTETDDVMRVIESKLNDANSVVSLKKQTEVYQAAQKLEALTTENLKRHDNRHKNISNQDILNVLDKKFKDLQLCKDIDDEAIGRGTRRNKRHTEHPLLAKIKELKAKHKVSPKCDEINEFTEEGNAYDDYNLPEDSNKSTNSYEMKRNAEAKIMQRRPTPKQQSYEMDSQSEQQSQISMQKQHSYDMDSHPKQSAAQKPRGYDMDSHYKQNPAQSQDRYDMDSHPKQSPVHKQHGYGMDSDSKQRYESPVEKRYEMNYTETKTTMKKQDETGYQPKKISHKKHRSPKNKIQDYDVKTHMRIAYSPPGVDKKKLVLKIVPKHKEEDPIETNKFVKEDEQIVKPKDDLYGEVDSAVDIKITNKDALRKYNDINSGESEYASKQDKRDAVQEEQKIETRSTSDVSSSDQSGLKSKILQKKLLLRTQKLKNAQGSSSSDTTSTKDTNKTNTTTELDSDDDVSELIEKYNADKVANATDNKNKNDDSVVDLPSKKNEVNPFKNLDQNLSVFVEKLLTPVLMVHTKNNLRIEPLRALTEVPFNSHVHNVLRNMNVEAPMTMQSVSWFSVLRGFSTFLIGPQGCGKTMGYIPSICRLISDFDNCIVKSVGPTCVIVAATAQSVSDIEYKCKMLLGIKGKILTCYAGMNLKTVTTSLLNGCELFICTPGVLVELLLKTDFGLDLRRLTTLVLDDCERLEQVYKSEVKILLSKVKDMLKTRVNKEVKVQYILASRVWCDFMEPLAKKAPNTVICIGAFQECVLYSKANTSVDFMKPENKIAKAIDFLEKVDKSKKTVIVCRSNEEVDCLEKVLKKKDKVVYACNNEMTVEELRSLNKAWDEHIEPILGPILVCCDGNLRHMNITDAHNLVSYSMPELFSTFCKRFSVLNDHYPSIFKDRNENVAIKIILEDSNAEQLPKICNFIKRCTKEFPADLDRICKEILIRKDMAKASNLVPICSNLLALGECPDFWYCRERHTSFPIQDEPKEWMPTDGIITFRILHYQTAVTYSARLLSNIRKDGAKKYPQTYSTLSFKLGTYFSQECNQKLHGVPKIGDICAVSISQNFFVRCQVVDIINKYRTGLPNYVLVKLIDEEKLETSRDIYLYHLPEEFKKVETYVVQVSLAGVLPKDKDITFSELAKHQVRKAAENDDSLYMRGKVVLTVGNRIFVDNIDVCQDLTSMNEIVVKNNFKEILAPHSEAFPDHIKTLKSRLFPGDDPGEETTDNTDFEQVEEAKPVKEKPKAQWAHLNREDLSLVYFTSALDPSTFFVRSTKFADMMESLCKDIKKYVEENPERLIDVKEHDIVLAQFPDSGDYERARVEVVENNKAKCFFVDYGDWREVSSKHLIEIPDRFIQRIPFQAIECRLIGIKPVGDEWTEFATNWFSDRCDVEDGDDLKRLYVQYFSTERAQFTGGNKYAVALIDTNGDANVVYNTQMIDLNLAAPVDDEIEILNTMDFTKTAEEKKGDESNDEEDWSITDANYKPVRSSNQPIRSMPLVGDDDSDSDRWSVNLLDDFLGELKPNNNTVKAIEMPTPKSDNSSDISSAKIDDESATSEYEVIKKIKIKELDSDDLSSVENIDISDMIKVNEGRRPKLLWRQNKTTVTIKIMLVGAENYKLVVQDRSIDFSSNVYDTEYKFNINLYGLVDKKKSSHSYKGQYILVKLFKVMHKTWLTLTKETYLGKWIVYDHDSIDTSSDEEDAIDNTMAEVIKNYHKDESESDDEFCDDANYSYPS